MSRPSSKLLHLLTNPTSLLHHHHRHVTLYHLPLLHFTTTHHLHVTRQNQKTFIPTKQKHSLSFSSRTTNNSFQDNNNNNNNNNNFLSNNTSPHPLPEWPRLMETLFNGGYFNGSNIIENELNGDTRLLPNEFLAAANSCFVFARRRPEIFGWLSRKDIEVIINEAYPFLFRNAEETERRMRSFLQIEGSNEATLEDLMKYVVSYASDRIFNPGRLVNIATYTSVGRILQELDNFAHIGQASDQGQQMPRNYSQASEQYQQMPRNYSQASEQYEQMPRNHDKQYEQGPRNHGEQYEQMPRYHGEQYEQGPRNYGPNITMKRGDWICPKCEFMNFARNTKCLECEEPRPKSQLSDGEWDCPRCNFFNYRKNVVCMKCQCMRPDADPSQGSNSSYVPSRHIQDTEKEEKTERWFKKVKELHGVADSRNEIPHDLPQVMPTQKEETRSLDNLNKDQRFSPYQGSTSGFVPFPPDYFAKKDNQQQHNSTESNNASFDRNIVQESRNELPIKELKPKPETSYVGQQTPESMNAKSGWTGKSLEGSAVTEPDPLDMSEEAKAERWFKRVAQIKDISELSQIPDEDFPSIMPMRKGVNRFVVSKRKTPLERRLTSPQYRKNLRIMSSDPMKKDDNIDD